jgi:hypothetical protein
VPSDLRKWTQGSAYPHDDLVKRRIKRVGMCGHSQREHPWPV